MRRGLLLALLGFALLPAACSRDLLDADVFAQPDLTGSVRIPLATTLNDGTTYLLRNATVEIGGSAMLTLSTRTGDLSTRGDALSSPLPPGQYTLFLRPGFQLIEVDPSGGQREVTATLSGSNPRPFAVRELEDATLKLSFAPADKNGDDVVFGVREPVRVTSVF